MNFIPWPCECVSSCAIFDTFNTHTRVGELKSIGIGDDLQENVVLVEDVGQLCVTSVIRHDLNKKNEIAMLNAKPLPC